MSIQIVKTVNSQEEFQQRIKQSTFLVVDDFDSMRKVTINQLRHLGATRIFEAGNGVEALRILSRQVITVVVSDWNMPVMNGLDLLLTIRSSPELFRLPFLMITSEAERDRVTQAIQVGVSELMVKPYTAGRLAERLAHVLKWQPRHNQPIDPVAVSAALGITVQLAGGNKATAPQKVELLDLANMVLSDGVEKGVQPVNVVHNQTVSVPKPVKVKPTILIVDDTPDNLTLLAHIFKEEYRVKIAHNGPKALALCQSDSPPDLVLLDIMMPEMDGFQVAEHMRSHPSSEHIPIIFVTALTDDASREKGLALGAVDFVTKPVNPDSLKIRVKNFMRYIDLHRELQSDFDNLMQNERLKDSVEQITRHDMKAPLSGVIGLAQGLAEADNLTNTQREQIHMIEETALQVLNMFNLSNELFKIEAGRFKLNPQPVPIADTIRRIAILMRKTFAFKDLSIAVGTPRGVGDNELMAQGDPMLCYSLFQNLFKNACEAAPEGSTVTASIFAESPLRITLENEGCVPAAIRDCFFEKFSTSGKADGTGLGTYSAKLLVEAQQGQISMSTSEERNTTCLTVVFPRF